MLRVTAHHQCALCKASYEAPRQLTWLPLGLLQDTAHAAASVHATVVSEEDAMSEGETHLSSRRAAASHSVPARSAQHPGAYVEERQASHHTAGQHRCRPSLATTQPALDALATGSGDKDAAVPLMCLHACHASEGCRPSATLPCYDRGPADNAPFPGPLPSMCG